MDDVIYRRSAIDAMLKLQAEDDEMYGCRIPEGFDGDRAKEALEQLPSAQPERKTGKWTKVHGEYICSECRTPREQYYGFFCGNCGAKMEGTENEQT